MDYNKLRTMADSKIGSFGDDFVVRCMTFGTYDPVADTYATSAASYDVKGLILNFSQRDIDGTLVQVGDKRVLLSALDSDGVALPALDTRKNFDIIYSSKVLNVLGIIPLKPGGTILLYKIHIRN